MAPPPSGILQRGERKLDSYSVNILPDTNKRFNELVYEHKKWATHTHKHLYPLRTWRGGGISLWRASRWRRGFFCDSSFLLLVVCRLKQNRCVCVQLISSCGCLLKEVLHLNLHHHWLMALKMSNGINASGNKGFKKYENRVHSQNALLGPFLNSTSAFCLFTVTFLVWHTSITKGHYTQIFKKKSHLQVFVLESHAEIIKFHRADLTECIQGCFNWPGVCSAWPLLLIYGPRLPGNWHSQVSFLPLLFWKQSF